jgi:hypothetical protein
LRVQGTLAWQLREALASGHSERIARLTQLLFDNNPRTCGDTV